VQVKLKRDMKSTLSRQVFQVLTIRSLKNLNHAVAEHRFYKAYKCFMVVERSATSKSAACKLVCPNSNLQQ